MKYVLLIWAIAMACFFVADIIISLRENCVTDRVALSQIAVWTSTVLAGCCYLAMELGYG
jgi:hypothetical protein